MHVTDLLAELSNTGIPPLPGASCRDHVTTFDKAVTNYNYRTVRVTPAQRRALAVCHECPALAACRTWVDGLAPEQRPLSVVAGELVPWHPVRLSVVA